MHATLTADEILERFGPIPAERIRKDPAPGSATERDVIDIAERENRLYELVDGILVEKTVGFYESFLAIELASVLRNFVRARDLGIVVGPDGTIRLFPGMVRIPDVSFASWDHFPRRKIPREPIPDLAPDLAVEVLSKGNTEKEMARKLDDYFSAGVRLVWYVEPRSKTVTVYTSPSQASVLHETDTLDRGTVLPTFSLPLTELFED